MYVLVGQGTFFRVIKSVFFLGINGGFLFCFRGLRWLFVVFSELRVVFCCVLEG